jgi:hypothetical protein
MSPQDLTVAIVLLLALGYGFVIGRSRVVAALLGLYAGFAVNTLVGPSLNDWLVRQGVFSANSTPWVQVILLLTVLVLFIYRFDVQAIVGRQRGLASHLLTAIFSFLAAALGLTLVLQLLVVAGQGWEDGQISGRLLDLAAVWASLPLLLWGVLSFLRR